MKRIAIIDYGMGNLDSVARAVEECGGSPYRVSDGREIGSPTGIILPGVGAFGDAIRNIKERGLDASMSEQVHGRSIPFLGVCLGMQLLATTGYESGKHSGLGWLDAEVRLLEPAARTERVPHVGWNNVDFVRESPVTVGLESHRDFYFVHSYHVRCADSSDVLATTPYAGSFVSMVHRGNIYGCQFHPEKSQAVGFELLSGFLAVCG